MFLVMRKQLNLKINYLYVLISPLEGKFHTDFKNDLKKFHTITDGPIFLIELQLPF